MRIWVTGSSGMLGAAVAAEARGRGHQVYEVTHDACPIEDRAAVKSALHASRAETVINCARVVPGKGGPGAMALANAVGPNVLAEETMGRRLIHLSTDCVFSGTDGRAPYSVADLPNPRDVYGRSRLAGEPLYPHVLTIRSSSVAASAGLGAWLRAQEGEVDGWTEAYWSGSSAPAVARAVVEMAEAGTVGLHHLAGESISKYWLLRRLSELWNLNLTVKPVEVPAINRTLIPTVGLPPLDEALKLLA